MAINLKFTKFDNTPWGFRLVGGSDFPQPLTVMRVSEGSLAECMGMKVGDVVVRLNDEPVSGMTHGQAHEALMRAGNNFVLAVQREEDPLKAVEGLTAENTVPYKISLADLPPVFPESILTEEAASERREEDTAGETAPEQEKVKPEVEELPDKPKDANSEIVPNQNLTDDEIAQLILEEEELLNDQGVLGVNFKKLRPRVPVLKESKVVEELQYIATEAPPRVQELKRTSTFLQKPQRPVPELRKKDEEPQEPAESYRVVIKKQQRRSVTDRLLERGLLRPCDPSPEPPTPEVIMASPETELPIHEELLPTSEIPVQVVEPPSETFELQVSLDSQIPTIRPPLDLATEGESHATPKMSKRKENPAQFSRRAPNKRNSRAFYTRGHYFRRCIFGNHGEAPRSKVKSSRKERAEESNGNCVLSYPSEVAQDRRPSADSLSLRVKGRYLETYLKRRESWPRRVIEPLFQHPEDLGADAIPEYALRARRSSAWRTRYAESVVMRALKFVIAFSGLEPLLLRCGPSVAKSAIRRRRFHMRGRYFERAIAKALARLSKRVREILLAADAQAKAKRKYCGMIKMRGHYVERCLERQSLRVASYIANYLGVPMRTQDLHRTRVAKHRGPKTPKRKISVRAHYAQRILGQYLSSFSSAAEYVCSSILPRLADSSEISHVLPLCSPRRELVDTEKSDFSRDNSVLNDILRSSGEFVSTEVFHRGSRRMSGLYGPRKSIAEDEKSGFSEILQSTGDYVSTEVFHRGSRRRSSLYGSRKSIGEEEKATLGEILQSTGDYVSTEVFHRGSRRRSSLYGAGKPIAEDEKGPVSDILQSTGDYVSTELFHRGSRRRSSLYGSKKPIAEDEKGPVSDILQSTGDYVSTELFHRGSRRRSSLYGPKKPITEDEKGALSDMLQSTGDFVSTEVFHRGSRRMSRLYGPRKSIAEEEKGALSEILQSTGDYVSTEVFHRRSRRMSRLLSPRVSISEDSSWLATLKKCYVNCFSRQVDQSKVPGVCGEKEVREVERDGRRLSFVPTVLYEGLTNRIGVDFTRFVAYAFVPCTSVILLYMYK